MSCGDSPDESESVSSGDSPRLILRYGFIDEAHENDHLRMARSKSWSGSPSELQVSHDLQQQIPLRPRHAEHPLDDEDTVQGAHAAASTEQAVVDSAQPSQTLQPSRDVDPPQPVEPSQARGDAETLHTARKCTPCVSLVVAKDCQLGRDCPYCHFSHEANLIKEQRPSKALRMKSKQAIEKCLKAGNPNKQNILEELQNHVVTQSPFARHYTVALLRDGQWLEIEDASRFQSATSTSSASSSWQATSALATSDSSSQPAASTASSSTKGGKRKGQILEATDKGKRSKGSSANSG